jgi:NAD(P)-dependent dehydrogenase (short-subunit alcohol dehydrogenase family)
MNQLANKTAVVTGGNSGIGYATAKEFLAQGAKVIISGRNPKAIEAAVRTLGPGASGIRADQSSLTDLQALADNAKKQYGHLDILVINAAVFSMIPIEAVTESQFDQMMDVNFKGAFFTLQKFLPLLRENSSVILVSSLNSHLGMENGSVYGATKGAMNSFVKAAVTELSPKGIRINSILPGPIATPAFEKLGLPKEVLEQFSGIITQRVPVKRFGQPADVAKLVSFLASEDASYITGSEYFIDGGISATLI